MGNNAHMRQAKLMKNDEFYTRFEDIAAEYGHYKQHFENRTIFCNCDDPRTSNFWRYFHLNFKKLKLKKLKEVYCAWTSQCSYE